MTDMLKSEFHNRYPDGTVDAISDEETYEALESLMDQAQIPMKQPSSGQWLHLRDRIALMAARLDQAVVFEVGRDPQWGDQITVVRRQRNPDLPGWSVVRAEEVWSHKDQSFRYEPRPSNRSDGFIADTRFFIEEAFEIAEAIVAGTLKERNV